jgi:AAA15 family ATPase/GTPase
MYSEDMLHSFKAKNFYSFKDEIFIDFTVNEKAPNTYSYIDAPSGDRLSKLEAVVGANASGKSSLLRATEFFYWLIVRSYKDTPDEKISVQGSKGVTGPTELEVTFEVKEKVYTYSFVVDRDRIWSEKLKATSMANQKKATKTLFAREWVESTQSYRFEDINFSLPKGADEKALLRSNASIVSAGIRFTHEESTLIAEYWKKFRTNISQKNLEFNLRVYFMEQAVGFYKTHPDIQKKASEYMAKFDLGLSGFNIAKIDSLKEEDEYEARFTHMLNGKKVTFPIDYESSGTQQLFITLTYILVGLQKGGLVVIDDIDLHLHPDIQTELMEMFTDPVLNPKNAQLLFTTQSPGILNKLDKYQIILCEKIASGYSEAWRLDKVGGVRADESYGTKYLAGAYGATPRL